MITRRGIIEARVLGMGVVTGNYLSYDITDPANENVCFLLKLYEAGVGNGIIATNGEQYYRCKYTGWVGKPLNIRLYSETALTKDVKNVIDRVIRKWMEDHDQRIES